MPIRAKGESSAGRSLIVAICPRWKVCAVSEGLKTTFDLLSTTLNEASVRALIPSLESPREQIREASLSAILRRRGPAGHREVLRRLHTFDDRWKEIFSENRGRLTPTLRDAVLGSDRQMHLNGCQAAIMLREYDLIPTLINAVEDKTNPNGKAVGETLLELVDALYSALASPRDYRDKRDPQLIREHVVSALDLSMQRFREHKRPEIVEAFLMLANRGSTTLQKIVGNPHQPAFLVIMDFLQNSPRPGIIRLLLGFLDDTRPPSAALSALSSRCDPKFINYLLRKIGREPSAAAAVNLKRIESIRWINRAPAILDEIDDAGQHGVITLVMNCGIPRAEAFNVVKHVLAHGKPGGRQAAASALAEFNGSEANQLALKALDDPDPRVQANVIVQLRRRGIPGVLPRLIEKVDGPHAIVREAARKSLSELSFKRFLGAFDMLDDDVRRSTGLLVKKVDPQTVPQLLSEMVSPARTRRLRSLQIARALEMVVQLENTVIDCLRDEDHMVRVEAAVSLGSCDSQASLDALNEALSDSSTAVCEATQASLKQRAQFSGWRDTLSDPRD